MSSPEIYQKNIGNREHGFFHHAFFLEGPGQKIMPEVLGFLSDTFAITQEGNPDFHQYHFHQLYIADAREIQAEESKRAFTPEAKKIFFISFHSMTHEAGNSFLKVLEEPSENSIFFFFAPSREALLPTLQSRCLMVDKNKEDESGEMRIFCEEFLKDSLRDRLQKLASIIKDKNKPEALQFLNTLEVCLRERVSLKTANGETLQAFEEIRKSRGYLRDTASSVKLLLEHVALVTPYFA